MESTGEEQDKETSKIILGDQNIETTHQHTADETTSNTATTTEDEETGGDRAAMAVPDGDSAGEEEEVEVVGREETPAVDEDGGHTKQVSGFQTAAEESEESQQKSLTSSRARPAPPSSLPLTEKRQMKKKVLAAPALSLSLGGNASITSDDLQSVFLSPSPEDLEDTGLDFDLDAIETPSDSESLHFPIYDLDLEDDLQRLGVASCHHKASGSSSRSDSGPGSLPGPDQFGLGALEREDVVDSEGTRWRCFTTGDPPQESKVNMSVLEPYLRVLSHGGYYGDVQNDIIVFSSCYLPENSLENYQYVMDNLFRFVTGTLELMVADNYVIIYLCAGGQKEKLPGIAWLKECYTTIDRRLRKNLKGLYVVHPTWYIKFIMTIIKPFISSKFSRKLQFVSTLQELSHFIPIEHVQIPDCVRQYDQNQSR
ncbi:bcl-2/adenovirus E1B 19 kDa-interacting protein 2-like protein isoform X1 [Girardinichthys multiradiatus]|uniref:bcl-2/adenovirus E1B 19 kDa-interacting protein 2-like protein isoform X1 n=1 Tax=Girardinichthys multiradiatus TaxID=208333 RepID=UPI001FAD2241|nr:bcl-2/adenovirus E1B 19 kDa-interacting protein 2-like protein isoform X1 [Girardinichthys multiradiatus]